MARRCTRVLRCPWDTQGLDSTVYVSWDCNESQQLGGDCPTDENDRVTDRQSIYTQRRHGSTELFWEATDHLDSERRCT